MYEQELKELGLTDNEVRIYLFLLERGAVSPSEISQKLGLHRGYVYDALERMHEKEVISSLLIAHKKHYQAISPQNLIELLTLRLENFKKIVPDLVKLSHGTTEETTIELHKGKRVYRTLLKDIIASLRRHDTVYLIGIDEKVLTAEVEPIYVKQYLNTIASKKIKEKIIIKRGGERLANKNLDYRELDAQCLGNTAQIIYGNTVALFIHGTPYYLIVIKNKEVAQTYKKQFRILWDCAR